MLPPLRKTFGVVVTSLLADAPAFGRHFLPGDVVYRVNQQSVQDVEGLVTAVTRTQSGEPVVVQVERGQKLMFIAFEVH